jgi:hypothetical protein
MDGDPSQRSKAHPRVELIRWIVVRADHDSDFLHALLAKAFEDAFKELAP